MTLVREILTDGYVFLKIKSLKKKKKSYVSYAERHSDFVATSLQLTSVSLPGDTIAGTSHDRNQPQQPKKIQRGGRVF